MEAARKRPCPLGQGSAHVFWKGPVNLLGFAGLLWLCHKHSILPWQYKSSHPQYINKWAWLCPYKTLLMGMENWISYNVHVSPNAILPLTFSQPFENVKAILSICAIQVVGQMWPAGCRWLTPAVGCCWEENPTIIYI